MEYTSIALSLVAVSIAIYYYVRKKYDLFKKYGIPHIPPSPVLGNMGPLLTKKKTMKEMIDDIYNLEPEAKYVGLYEFLTPIIMIRDLDLIKAISTKNFDHFPDHRPFVNDDSNPLFSKMLFTQTGDRWREERTMLSPTFTSSKIKNMFRLMTSCAERFTDWLANLPENDREKEMKELLSMYANDVITGCVYGANVDTRKDPKNVFYVYARIATRFTSFMVMLKLLLYRHAPWIAKAFRMRFINSRIEKFFKDVVTETVKERERTGAQQPNVIQLMMNTKSRKAEGRAFSMESIAAHAFTFFFGGFDSVSTQFCFVIRMLAEHPDVQRKLQEEIEEALEKGNGQISYEVMHEMKYLDAVINETMRLYAIVPFLDRVCTSEYELPPAVPGAKPFTVRPGMILWIPSISIQRDPKYFEDPQKFDPDRFLQNGKRILSSGAFLAFGIGPRMCIGNRFALTEIKVLLCHFLARCNVLVGSKTTVPLKLQKGTLSVAVDGGFWLKLEPRKDLHPSLRANGTVDGVANGVVHD
ncbi:unnamed protein product [Xylocopa violacea]|uniref:Cytochrome P450 n=1 Tax=Xylocopa violacea TaxID=135666 RepID=A0ABP1P5W5_XYLVO